MDRRTFGHYLCSAFALPLLRFASASGAPMGPLPQAADENKPPLRTLPKQVAGIRIPDSAVARAAIEEAYES